MASLTPAERAGIANDFGSLEVGKQADLVVLNRNFEVKQVFVGGKNVV
jgi:N-acetylglucosamine-6-phosphate deacetylase